MREVEATGWLQFVGRMRDDLHNQTVGEGARHFRAPATPLDSQSKFLRLSRLNPKAGAREIPAGYDITSYILRQRKNYFGGDIVQKHRHIVRVPMGGASTHCS